MPNQLALNELGRELTRHNWTISILAKIFQDKNQRFGSVETSCPFFHFCSQNCFVKTDLKIGLNLYL